MKEILKPVFEWIIGNYSLFENDLFNYIVMGFIGVCAFKISFNFVGDLYRCDLIDGKIMGSIIHWFVRLIVFFLLFATTSIIIWAIRIIIIIPVWVWCLLLGLIVTVGIFFIIRPRVK